VTGRSGSQLTLLNSTSRALAKVKEAKTNRRLKAGDMVDGLLQIGFTNRISKKVRKDLVAAYF
jgi:hypothetical protein